MKKDFHGLFTAMQEARDFAKDSYTRPGSSSFDSILLGELKRSTGLDFYVLGEGLYRIVLETPKYPGLVFKLVREENSSSNVREYEFYKGACRKIRSRLATCKGISECGQVLVMKKIEGELAHSYFHSKYHRDCYKHEDKLMDRLEREIGQYDLHGSNVMYVHSRRKFIVIDYAGD